MPIHRHLLCLLLILLLGSSSCTIKPREANPEITVEVAIFEGGLGIEWHKQMAREYERLHPGIKINLWGDPRVDEKLKPRILRGSPPDVANSQFLPTWKLIVAGKLLALDEVLDSPAYGQPGTWRESFLPGTLADYRYQGKTYAVPTYFGEYVAWYDRRLFREHGWTVPKTWGEFATLCDKIKAAGIAPIAFQGKYPIYAWPTLLSIYQRLVPFSKWYEIQDLKPGAFQDPEFIKAATLLQEASVKYFQTGCFAMTHTESQLEWVNGRAAIVVCGLWLKNEMKDAIPPGFEIDCFPIPPVEGGQGDPRAVYGGGGSQFFVFSEAKHAREGADFLKFLVSKPAARSYTETLDSLLPIRDSVEGVKISPAMKGAVTILENSSRVFADRLGGLYLEFAKTELPIFLGDLLANKITPQEFGRRMEASAEVVRKNPDIYKPPALGVPEL